MAKSLSKLAAKWNQKLESASKTEHFSRKNHVLIRQPIRVTPSEAFHR